MQMDSWAQLHLKGGPYVPLTKLKRKNSLCQNQIAQSGNACANKIFADKQERFQDFWIRDQIILF